jgi:sulfur-oxidizing protein SoxX
MGRWTVVTLLVVLLALAGCSGRRSPSGFRLPPGNAEAGKAAFVSLNCTSCHTVAGAELPAPDAVPVVALGGPRALPPTDGDLTADIIVPSSHFAWGYPAAQVQSGAKSKMPDYAEQMTVRQLADLVAFLQDHYSVGAPRPGL